jgi:hypothetical protein
VAKAKELARQGYEPVLKKTRWLLLKRREHLTDEQAVSLRQLTGSSDEAGGFCLSPPVDTVQGSNSQLSPPGQWRYIHRSGNRRSRRVKALWGMSVQVDATGMP